MIDFTNEDLLLFVEAARSLPGRPHISTLHRWRLRGVRGVRLESVLIGGRRYTSLQALELFFAATTAAADGEVAPVRTAKERKRAIERAENELLAAGI
jgi:hypothetical protein